jgi:cell wall assembly regulator SMI1
MNASPMEYEDLYWADGHVDTQDFIGMYGYLNHVNKNRLWNNLGTFYAIFGQSNDENSNDNTMIPSAFLYNPNNVPVKITYMIFS